MTRLLYQGVPGVPDQSQRLTRVFSRRSPLIPQSLEFLFA